MAKQRQERRIVAWNYDDDPRPIVPIVDYSETPRIRIYDAANDGTYWFRKAGFNRTITDDD